MTGEKTLHFTDDNFEAEILRSSDPVLVDFWAPWCGPCRALGPIVERLAADYDGVVKVGKLNVDDNPEASRRYGIRSIPTLILFKEGRPVASLIGTAPMARIEEMIRRHVPRCEARRAVV